MYSIWLHVYEECPSVRLVVSASTSVILCIERSAVLTGQLGHPFLLQSDMLCILYHTINTKIQQILYHVNIQHWNNFIVIYSWSISGRKTISFIKKIE